MQCECSVNNHNCIVWGIIHYMFLYRSQFFFNPYRGPTPPQIEACHNYLYSRFELQGYACQFIAAQERTCLPQIHGESFIFSVTIFRGKSSENGKMLMSAAFPGTALIKMYNTKKG